ncbi:MAG: hypothetical protein ACOYN0_07380 [Phycisphaerales bacterium]
MQGAKPWQYVVLVLCVAGAGVGFWMNLFGGEKPQFAKSIMLADVRTGELFEVPLGKKSLMLPMARPGAQEKTLYPVTEIEGKWIVEGRYREEKAAAFKESKVVDSKTGEVTVTGPAKELNP